MGCALELHKFFLKNFLSFTNFLLNFFINFLDNDADSVDDSISLDCTFDHEIVDTVQYLVDSVCGGEEEEEGEEVGKEGEEEEEEDELNEAILLNNTFNGSSNDSTTIINQNKEEIKEPDEISLVGSLKTSAATGKERERVAGQRTGGPKESRAKKIFINLESWRP